MWTTNNYVKKNVSKKSNLIFLYNTTNNNSNCYSDRFFIKIITLTCNLFNSSSSMKHKVILNFLLIIYSAMIKIKRGCDRLVIGGRHSAVINSKQAINPWNKCSYDTSVYVLIVVSLCYSRLLKCTCFNLITNLHRNKINDTLKLSNENWQARSTCIFHILIPVSAYLYVIIIFYKMTLHDSSTINHA